MKRCPLHHAEHSVNKCRGFRNKTFEERKKILRDNNVCYKCCESNKHLARDCKALVKGEHCGLGHASAMHIDRTPTDAMAHGGENNQSQKTEVTPKCTALCGDKFVGKSCSKTLLVDVYCSEQPENVIRAYAIIDDQSNCSLATSKLFDQLKIQSTPILYTLSSCSGKSNASGRRASDICICSLDSRTVTRLSSVIECDDIPNDKSEIPTAAVVKGVPTSQAS